jgi:CRISPR-associated protein Cas2
VSDAGERLWTGAGAVRYLIAYDIADDRRRDDVATLLSGYGPRVQLSVFECDVNSRREAAGLRAKLRDLIDPVEDQVRVYPLSEQAARGVIVIGARVIEERQDFWIVT